jgi:hypothetical protein
MKKRLFVFGCSYSAYIWPTWADFIGIGFDEKWNYAQPGLGNRAIFERLVQAISKHKITADDTVLVQWTHHTRFDWHLNRDILDRGQGWQTQGSLFVGRNTKFFGRDWMQKFFDEESYYMHTFNFILGAKYVLENINCTWKFTQLLDLEKYGSEDSTFEKYDGIVNNLGGRILATKTTPSISVWEKFPRLAHFEQSIFKDIEWLPCMKDWISKHGETKNYKVQRSIQTGSNYDPHPVASNHLAYANAVWDLDTATKTTADEWVKIIDNTFVGGKTEPLTATEVFEEKLLGWRMYFYEM